jgi:hypothetical protein
MGGIEKKNIQLTVEHQEVQPPLFKQCASQRKMMFKQSLKLKVFMPRQGAGGKHAGALILRIKLMFKHDCARVKKEGELPNSNLRGPEGKSFKEKYSTSEPCEE